MLKHLIFIECKESWETVWKLVICSFNVVVDAADLQKFGKDTNYNYGPLKGEEKEKQSCNEE